MAERRCAVKLLRGHVNHYGYYYGVTGLSAPGKSVFMSAFIEGVVEGVAGLGTILIGVGSGTSALARKVVPNTFHIGWCEWVRPRKRTLWKIDIAHCTASCLSIACRRSWK